MKNFKREVATERADRPHNFLAENHEDLSCQTCGESYRDARGLHLTYEAEQAAAPESGSPLIAREIGS